MSCVGPILYVAWSKPVKHHACLTMRIAGQLTICWLAFDWGSQESVSRVLKGLNCWVQPFGVAENPRLVPSAQFFELAFDA